ncbi:MAG: hypothetical protein MUF10_13400 [Thermoanaerobaculaceae bacterium]|nr:hypothetical protein [Thermoanaerobaculaceae bacterium]
MGHQGTARLFGDDGIDVAYTLEGPGDLTQVLGDGPARQASVRLATPSASIAVLGEELTLGANLDATACVHERGWPIDGFEQAPIAGPRAGRVAELRLACDASARIATARPRSPWSLSLRATGQTRFASRHLLLVGEAHTLGEAFEDLLGRVQWPCSARLDDLAEGELHTLEASLGLDLGLTLSRGFEQDVKWTLLEVFDDAPAVLRAHAEGLVKAAVGAGLQEELVLAVGRVGTVTPGWVRIRLRRRHEGSITFGARLALQVRYDLGSSLVAVLDRVLELEPLGRLAASLGEVACALATGEEGWQQQVSALAARRVGELVGEQGWLDSYASDPRVRRLMTGFTALVETWEQLDETVTSFWEHVLASATGGRTATIRAVLEVIAAIDPEHVTLGDLVGSGRYHSTIELVETFSGHSLEELLAGTREELRVALARARTLAKEALRLLDLDQEVLEGLHTFAQETGIEACVAWIKEHATSIKKLRTLATTTIESLVEKVLGKALDRIGAADLQRLRRWARAVGELLDQREGWEQALRAEMERLRGDLGCSAGIEVGRLLRRTAIIDLEIDPAGRTVRRAVQRALAAADIRALLEALPDEPPRPAQRPTAPPFLLRECAFASRRERWANGSWLLGSLTAGSGRRRIVESAVRVVHRPPSTPGAPAAFARHAATSGGFVRSVKGSAAVQLEAGVWLDLAATGPGNHLAAPYDTVARTLCLAVLRHDLATSTSQGEPAAMVRLLADLGFEATGEDARLLPDLDGRETSLAVRISLPHTALDALVAAAAHDDTWSTAYLNAAFRWLEPGLEENEANDLTMNRGAICRALILDPRFRANWTRSADVARWAPSLPEVRQVAGTPIPPRKPFGTGRWQPDFVPLGGMVGAAGGPGVDGLVSWRPWSAARLRALAAAQPSTATRPDDLVAACDRFAALLAASPGVWEEPLFGIWLVLALLVRTRPEALAGATGLATLRWRARKADPWQGPALWRLPETGLHVPDDPDHRQVFPL